MTAPDVIQQARDALAAWNRASPYDAPEPEWVLALRLVVKAGDAGHLIDTRRLVELGGRDDVAVTLEVESNDGWTVYRRASWSDQPWQMGYGPTAAEALAAAERAAAEREASRAARAPRGLVEGPDGTLYDPTDRSGPVIRRRRLGGAAEREAQ